MLALSALTTSRRGGLSSTRLSSTAAAASGSGGAAPHRLRRGDVFVPVLRDVPVKEGVLESHLLMIRAGVIRKSSAPGVRTPGRDGDG